MLLMTHGRRHGQKEYSIELHPQFPDLGPAGSTLGGHCEAAVRLERSEFWETRVPRQNSRSERCTQSRSRCFRQIQVPTSPLPVRGRPPGGSPRCADGRASGCPPDSASDPIGAPLSIPLPLLPLSQSGLSCFTTTTTSPPLLTLPGAFDASFCPLAWPFTSRSAASGSDGQLGYQWSL